jgi:hypothetical protein
MPLNSIPSHHLQSAPRQTRAVSLMALQQQRPASVPWELGAGPVPCSDRRRVSLEPAVQSRTEMLRKSAQEIYIMPRNLGQQHTPPRGARALAGGELPPIERWNRARGQSRGEGTNHLRCRSVFFAHGNELCIAKELCAVSKPALEHFVVVNLAVNFPQKNRSGGSRGSCSTCMRGANSLRLFHGEASPLSVLVPTGGGESEYCSVAYSTLVHSAEVNDMKSFSPLTDW